MIKGLLGDMKNGFSVRRSDVRGSMFSHTKEDRNVIRDGVVYMRAGTIYYIQ